MEKKYLSNEEKEQILNQVYLSADDLKKLMPSISHCNALKHIKEVRDEMVSKGYYLPSSRTKLALTKLVRKRFGF